MRTRTKVYRVVGALIAVGTLAGWFWWPKADTRPRLVNLVAQVTPAPAKIVVGENVQASQANPDAPHAESVIAADFEEAARLFVVAMYRPPGSKDFKLAGYLSHDGGATWSLAFERKGDQPEEHFGDPTVALGPDGLLCVAYIRKNLSGKPDAKYGDPTVGRIEFLRSTDAGETWEEVTSIPQYFDRPWIAIDRSTGPHRGRLYCTVKEYKPFVFISLDQGRTFLPPVFWPVDLKRHSPIRPGNVVTLSDGTVVVHYYHNKLDPNERAHIPVLTSQDGGQSFQQQNYTCQHFLAARASSHDKLVRFPANGCRYAERRTAGHRLLRLGGRHALPFGVHLLLRVLRQRPNVVNPDAVE